MVKTKYDRNDPSRFFDNGVVFKAKLIGVLEVGEARGDRMCQEALQELKIAIRAAGEHKQRIQIHVTIEGLRLRDERTGDSLYHHPVHKISFIAQDMTDSRAFGYIFGSPDSGHRFFGIKTDKAASQVVLAMRDLFQVVFELKKKEIELAKQQLQNKVTSELQPTQLLKDLDKNSTTNKGQRTTDISRLTIKEKSPESVADLVDLEQELSSIQRGITQMEKITPSETLTIFQEESDPFGDSFTSFPAYNLLPPPESSRSRNSKSKSTDVISKTYNTIFPAKNMEISHSPPNRKILDGWNKKESVTTESLDSPSNFHSNKAELVEFDVENRVEDVMSPNNNLALKYSDAFTDLDPLGTGKNRPYIDKKFFFHELKNPPKKILKDLSGRSENFPATFSADKNNHSFEIDASLVKKINNKSEGKKKQDTISKAKINSFMNETKTAFKNLEKDLSLGFKEAEENVMIPRDTDPFSPTRKKSDPFHEQDLFAKFDPFEIHILKKLESDLEFNELTSNNIDTDKKENRDNRALQVNLPPAMLSSNLINRQTGPKSSVSSIAISRNRPSIVKQDTIQGISTKNMQQLFGPKLTKQESNSINMKPDPFNESETAPEPPPRPDLDIQIDPPPLPPKKQLSEKVFPPAITSSSAAQSISGLDYSASKVTSILETNNVPPIPLPLRKVCKLDTLIPEPARSNRKQCEENDYLSPISIEKNVPTLLTPPQKKGSEIFLEQTRKSLLLGKKKQCLGESKIPNITLSQLLTLGIDDLASELGVSVTKLSMMTLVELTAYISEFIKKSKKTEEETITSKFMVDSDQNSDTTFVAEFDNKFGKATSPISGNFTELSENSHNPSISNESTNDRYAMLREIIENELSREENTLPNIFLNNVDSPTKKQEQNNNEKIEQVSKESLNTLSAVLEIDTRITQAISNAKDRYAALRDIILVENILAKPSATKAENESTSDNNENIFNQFENRGSISAEVFKNSQETVVFPQIKEECLDHINFSLENEQDKKNYESMNRVLSNLSIDSVEHFSPDQQKNLKIANDKEISQSIQAISPSSNSNQSILSSPSQINDMLTSPIQNSPSVVKITINTSRPESPVISELINAKETNNIGSPSDIICDSSPESNSNIAEVTKPKPLASKESWENFDKNEKNQIVSAHMLKAPKVSVRTIVKSPCSSDGKEKWKDECDVNKQWPRSQTSSSSRDASPMDDEGYDYIKHSQNTNARHDYCVRRDFRINCEKDYDYDEEMLRRRERTLKGYSNGTPEFSNNDGQYWYHHHSSHQISPTEDDLIRSRKFDRVLYEQNNYGPSYDEYCRKISTHASWDRREFKHYDKRPYHKEYNHKKYDFKFYDEPLVRNDRKFIFYTDPFEKDKLRQECKRAYNQKFLRAAHKIKFRDCFYNSERSSFDNDSPDSFESEDQTHKNFGSGEVYGNLNNEQREKYRSAEKSRSIKKNMKMQSCGNIEQDSVLDVQSRCNIQDVKNLQRPLHDKHTKKNSVSSPWDGEDFSFPKTGNKVWRRPSSASEFERRLIENRRIICSSIPGSDGEKDKRVRKKHRSRVKGNESHALEKDLHSHNTEFTDYEDLQPRINDDKFENLHRHHTEMHQQVFGPERLQRNEYYEFEANKDIRYIPKNEKIQKNNCNLSKCDIDFIDYEHTILSNSSSPKFDIEEQGFESDFTPTSPFKGSPTLLKNSFHFSDYISEKDAFGVRKKPQILTAPKQRFDENTAFSKFDNKDAFGDNFNKAEFALGNENQCSTALPKRNVKNTTKRQENIKKSESVNIFSQKLEDPFENDDFFKSSKIGENFRGSFCQWQNNFAMFEENMTFKKD